MKAKSTTLAATIGFAILTLFTILWYLSQPAYVYAATYTVTKTADTDDGTCDADCSLREAIDVSTDDDTITIPAGTYTLTLGELLIAGKNITLTGNTPDDTIIASGVVSRVLNIDGSDVLLENLTLTNGQEAEGGGIYANYWSNLTLSNTVVVSNSASIIGGGIYFNQENHTLTLLNNSKVLSNTASIAGGGIYVDNGDIQIEDGTVSYNTASEAGGIAVQYNARLYFNDGEISHNQSTVESVFEYPGGGIRVFNGTAYLNGGKIINNSSYRGGGIMIENGTAIQAGTLISNNTATYGGGVYVALGEAIFTQTSGSIQQNTSTGVDFGGGGLYIFEGTANLLGGQVISNVANNHGGGMELRLGRLTVDGSTISNNQAGAWGGGIFNSGGLMTITNGTIINNQAYLGGGIATNSDNNGPSQNKISHSAILSNTAVSENGGGIQNRGVMTITNSTLSGNSAYEGGGIYNRQSIAPTAPDGIVSITNVTLGYNQAITSGGGIENNFGTFSIANTIIVSNTAPTDTDCSGTITTFDYNLTSCTLTGLGSNDISGDPLLQPLALNGGVTLNFALTGGSPAIDTGGNAFCPTDDQRGFPRPNDGDNNSSALCDIGAYEYGLGYFIRDLIMTETESTQSVNVTVERTYSSETSTVEYALMSNTAMSGTDYTDISGTLNFDAGEVSQTIQIDILGDTLDEFNETFFVILSNPSPGITIGDGEATVTIMDNDATPTLTINDATVTEVDGSNSVTATFTATLSAQSGKPITVAILTEDDTAVSNADYITKSGTLNFAPGTTTAEIEIVVAGDDLDEFDETFELNLNPVANGNVTISDSQGVGTIIDNDDPPNIAIGTTLITEVDGGSTNVATFTVQLSAPSGKSISATYNTAEGTALEGSDFIAVSNGTLNFAPGETEKTVNITVNGDDIYEGNQTFSVQLTNLENVAENGNTTTAVATIQDNEAQPTITIVSSNNVNEGDTGTTVLDFDLTLSGPTEEDVTVTYNTTHVTTDGNDFDVIVNGTITFTSPSTSETISIIINGDTDSESDETFEINLSNPTVATISGSGQAIGTIIDDDGYFIFLPMIVKP